MHVLGIGSRRHARFKSASLNLSRGRRAGVGYFMLLEGGCEEVKFVRLSKGFAAQAGNL